MMQNEELTKTLTELLEENNYTEVKSQLSELTAPDIELALEEIPLERLPLIFRLLPKELAAETFAEMEGDMQAYLIKSFSDSELRYVLSEMYVDDTVDLIEEMPANVVRRILASCDHETRSAINEILKYPKNSAGSIMTTEYVTLYAEMTIDEAFAKLRREALQSETVYTCYVIDRNRKLIGVVTVCEMLAAREKNTVSDIMETSVVSVGTLEDREEAVSRIQHYGFLALPVVDNEERLVGIITVDDAIDVMREEDTEDIEIMAAITPSDKTYMKTGVFATFGKRIPWLILLMLSATFTGKIIASFEDALAACVVLTGFIPMLMGTGGNAAGQASTTVIRGISLGEIELGSLPRIIWKEIRVSLLCAAVLAIVGFGKSIFIDNVSMTVAAVVSATLAITVIFAKIVGCTLPVAAKTLKLDPAVMASPFITTIVDAISLYIYFIIASTLLGI